MMSFLRVCFVFFILLVMNGRVCAFNPSAELCLIADQLSVIGHDFSFNLNGYLSTQTLGPVTFTLSEDRGQDTGLYVDNDTRQIMGKPKSIGNYSMTLSAKGPYGLASEVKFRINVAIDPSKTPILRQTQTMENIQLGQEFSFDLMKFLTNPSKSDRVRFTINSLKPHPKWLSIVNHHFLSGTPTAYDAGQKQSISVVAVSNAGGSSRPLTISFQVAYNFDKKPSIKPFNFKHSAGHALALDLRSKVYVQGAPVSDPSLVFNLNHITPQALWLDIDARHPSQLIGVVPRSAVGRNYLISLVASTQEGGPSEMENIVLTVVKDVAMTPRFLSNKPDFPPLIPGQEFIYDFVHASGDNVFPSYATAPYDIKFAQGFEHPMWLRIENNRLISDEVPLNEWGAKSIVVSINNKLGGESKPIELVLLVLGVKQNSIS